MSVAISVCSRCRRFAGAALAPHDEDLALVPWFLTETECTRCLWRGTLRNIFRAHPLPAALGLIAFGSFGLLLGWV